MHICSRSPLQRRRVWYQTKSLQQPGTWNCT